MSESQSPAPFHELSELYGGLQSRKLHESVDGSMVKQLLDAASMIEKARNTAAEMQLGAEGFDNSQRARLYRQVQEHLLAAMRELIRASAALKHEIELWPNLER